MTELEQAEQDLKQAQARVDELRDTFYRLKEDLTVEEIVK